VAPSFTGAHLNSAEIRKSGIFSCVPGFLINLEKAFGTAKYTNHAKTE
jgi:hypothetical protein